MKFERLPKPNAQNPKLIERLVRGFVTSSNKNELGMPVCELFTRATIVVIALISNEFIV